MRFVSKNSNLMIVLKPGLPAQPLSGTPARAGLYIKFKSGIAEIKDEEIVAMMKAHAGFNNDFIAVEEDAITKDPFEDMRVEQEPAHHLAEIKYGHVESPKSSPKKAKLTPEMKKMVQALALEQVKLILPEAVKMALEATKAAEESAKEARG